MCRIAFRIADGTGSDVTDAGSVGVAVALAVVTACLERAS
jgi:hypothetical protein